MNDSTKSTINSIIRALFMLLAAFLVGKHFGGTAITSGWLDTAAGIIIAVVTTAFGIASKTAKEDQIVAAFKQLAVFVGGILVTAGKLTADNLNMWIGVGSTLLSLFLSNKYKALSAT